MNAAAISKFSKYAQVGTPKKKWHPDCNTHIQEARILIN
jgi:hypothetical protein